MKHETRLLSLEIKSKNLPMLCLLPHTLKSGDRHCCLEGSYEVEATRLMSLIYRYLEVPANM